jgi:erythromycin esterase-like protein
MRRGDSRALVRRNPHEWTATYDDLAQRLENGLATLRREFAPDSTAPIVACQIARGTSFLATALASDVTYEATRDEGMADNVECLLRLHPSAKIIVIAHNDHVRHANAWVARDPVRRMGTWIKSKHPDGVYTVGMKMYRGQAAFNDGRVYDVRSSEPGTLESSLFHAGRRYHFVDLLHAAPASGTAWMFSPIESFSWGWFRETFVPRDQYDGLLFVDTVSPAQPLLR